MSSTAQAALPPKAPSPPDGGSVTIPSTIDASCQSDVTQALNDVIQGTPDNRTIQFPAQACYRIDSTLTLTGRSRLDIEGNGAALRAGTEGDQNRRHLVISNSTDIIVRGLTVMGSNDKAGATLDAYNADLAFQHAFVLSGDQRVLLDHVAAGRLHGDFVNVAGNATGTSTDITITGSKFDGSGRQGISVTDGERVLIVDNDIANVARSMFDLEPHTNGIARDIRISGNRTGAAVNFWLANKGASDLIGPIEIDGNTMQASTGGLFFAFGHGPTFRGPWVVRDNHFIANNAVTDEGSVGAFLFAFCDNVSIVGNQVTFPPGMVMPAIELRGSQNVHVTGNDFTGASQEIMADAATTGVSTSS